ncbi:MAG TPA: oligopeptide:H+ symporter [Terriglobales bacterium]|nr:oligopeptide:H+ symporter [Terriglobales bacterium]
MGQIVTGAPTQHFDRSFFGHPRGLATLFFTEMWERYSFYGTRALLMLYMTHPLTSGALGFSDMKAGAIYGFYTATVYLLSLPGGWFADRIVGQRKAVLFGGILIAAGDFCLASPGIAMYYAGLGLLMIGTGLLKPNVSTMVGQLYAAGDRRRDSGFSIFYMGINIGAFSPLLVSWVGEKINWRLAFATSGVGMVLGVVQYLWTGKYLGGAGLHPSPIDDPKKDRTQKRTAGAIAIVALLALAALVTFSYLGKIQITAQEMSNGLAVVLVAISVAVFAWMIFGKGWSPIERKRAGAMLVLFIGSAVFWGAYEQAGSSLNLFADVNTNRHILGYEFPAGWFQWVQPLFVLILAPFFAWLWIKLGSREPSSPAKFSIALLFIGLSFLVLVPAAHRTGVSPNWLNTCYFLGVVGEMCLSPVGLSAFTKLAPSRAAGFAMGIWFLSTSIGEWLAGKAGSMFGSMPLPKLFGISAFIPFIAAIALALLIKPTKRLMSGVS